jgi:hypothetical protein
MKRALKIPYSAGTVRVSIESETSDYQMDLLAAEISDSIYRKLVTPLNRIVGPKAEDGGLTVTSRFKTGEGVYRVTINSRLSFDRKGIGYSELGNYLDKALPSEPTIFAIVYGSQRGPAPAPTTDTTSTKAKLTDPLEHLAAALGVPKSAVEALQVFLTLKSLDNLDTSAFREIPGYEAVRRLVESMKSDASEPHKPAEPAASDLFNTLGTIFKLGESLLRNKPDAPDDRPPHG